MDTFMDILNYPVQIADESNLTRRHFEASTDRVLLKCDVIMYNLFV